MLRRTASGWRRLGAGRSPCAHPATATPQRPATVHGHGRFSGTGRSTPDWKPELVGGFASASHGATVPTVGTEELCTERSLWPKPIPLERSELAVGCVPWFDLTCRSFNRPSLSSCPRTRLDGVDFPSFLSDVGTNQARTGKFSVCVLLACLNAKYLAIIDLSSQHQDFTYRTMTGRPKA
jgi:hypothetical protein